MADALTKSGGVCRVRWRRAFFMARLPRGGFEFAGGEALAKIVEAAGSSRARRGWGVEMIEELAGGEDVGLLLGHELADW